MTHVTYHIFNIHLKIELHCGWGPSNLGPIQQENYLQVWTCERVNFHVMIFLHSQTFSKYTATIFQLNVSLQHYSFGSCPVYVWYPTQIVNSHVAFIENWPWNKIVRQKRNWISRCSRWFWSFQISRPRSLRDCLELLLACKVDGVLQNCVCSTKVKNLQRSKSRVIPTQCSVQSSASGCQACLLWSIGGRACSLHSCYATATQSSPPTSPSPKKQY